MCEFLTFIFAGEKGLVVMCSIWPLCLVYFQRLMLILFHGGTVMLDIFLKCLGSQRPCLTLHVEVRKLVKKQKRVSVVSSSAIGPTEQASKTPTTCPISKGNG